MLETEKHSKRPRDPTNKSGESEQSAKQAKKQALDTTLIRPEALKAFNNMIREMDKAIVCSRLVPSLHHCADALTKARTGLLIFWPAFIVNINKYHTIISTQHHVKQSSQGLNNSLASCLRELHKTVRDAVSGVGIDIDSPLLEGFKAASYAFVEQYRMNVYKVTPNQGYGTLRPHKTLVTGFLNRELIRELLDTKTPTQPVTPKNSDENTAPEAPVDIKARESMMALLRADEALEPTPITTALTPQ